MDSVQKLLQLFSFQSKDIDQSTQLIISTLNEDEIKYSIVKNSFIQTKSLKNTYRIQLKPNILSFRQYLVGFINKFSVKKLVVNVNNFQSFNFAWEILKNIHFQEVRLIEGVKPQKQQINMLIQEDENNRVLYKVEKLLTSGPDFDFLKIQLNATCKQLLSFSRVIEKYELIISQKQVENKLEQLKIEQKQIGFRVNKRKNRKFQYIFHLSIYSEEQLLYLIYQWTQQKISYCQTFREGLIQTESFYQNRLLPHNKLSYSNKISIQIEESLLKQLRNEIIMIYIKEEHILTLSSCSDYGYNIRLGKRLSIQENVTKIINKVLSSPYFISLEIEDEALSLLGIVDFVFHHYHYHSNYLIKIGNQVQLTSYRMMLNTNNLPSVIVRRLIKLLQFPGHYEFIFYGSLDYFQQVRLLFMQKPFTKFNYFLPIEQVSNQICQLINKMESIAEEFKQKVIQFCSLLQDFSYKEINLIEDVYINLHLKDFQKKL